MLYGEFLEGTGAKDCQQTFFDYKNLENIYLDHDYLEKQDIYDAYKLLLQREVLQIVH